MKFDTLIDRKGSGCFKYDALQLIYGTNDLIPLWVADMDYAVADVVQTAISRRLSHPIFGYNFPKDEFAISLRDWMQKRFHWDTGEHKAISVPSLMTALAISILSLTKEGDGILIQTPVYPPFHSTVQDHKRFLLRNPLLPVGDHYEVDWADFEAKAAQAKMFILCNPHNPVGKVFSKEELLRVHDICSRHDVLIFSDEIHADITYPACSHIPIASLGGNNVITGISPAKSFNLAGLATAMMFAPNNHLANALEAMNESLHTFMGNSFGIAAFTAAYSEGASWQNELLEYLQSNRDMLIDFFAQETPEISMARCEGTFLAWLDCRALGYNDEKLMRFFTKQAKVALNPGTAFGTEGSGFVRLNFACPKSILELALNRILRALRNR
jgi:cystathionine beta-lyase